MTFPITLINKASSFSNSLPSPTSQSYDCGGEEPLSIPNLSHTKHLSATLYLFNTITCFGQMQEYCHLYIQGVTGGTDQTSGGCSLC
jgi:hypothetical protein